MTEINHSPLSVEQWKDLSSKGYLEAVNGHLQSIKILEEAFQTLKAKGHALQLSYGSNSLCLYHYLTCRVCYPEKGNRT